MWWLLSCCLQLTVLHMSHCRKKPSQPSAGKVKAAAAEDMLALLHEEPSKRGPQTMEASVARVMRRMLEQVCRILSLELNRSP